MMNELVSNLTDWWQVSAQVAHLQTHRWLTAQRVFVDQMRDAFADSLPPDAPEGFTTGNVWAEALGQWPRVWWGEEPWPRALPHVVMPAAGEKSREAQQTREPGHALGQRRHFMPAAISAFLNLYRDIRDLTSEALLVHTYGTLAVLGIMEMPPRKPPEKAEVTAVPFVKQVLAHIDRGGYPEAVARVGALLGQGVVLIRRDDLRFIDGLMSSDRILSQLTADEIRRLRDEQLVITGRKPEQALRTLPKLLRSPEDRQRILSLIAKISHMKLPPNARRKAMLQRIQAIVASPPSASQRSRECLL